MIRPDEILTAVGGKLMESIGVDRLQNGRVGQDQLSSFTRSTKAWARVKRNLWAQVSTNAPRYELVTLRGQLRLALTIESSGLNAFRFSDAISPNASTLWVPTSTSDTFATGHVSMLQGRTARRFTNAGGSTGHGIYQDAAALSTAWATLSAMVEEGTSTGFAFRIRDQTSSAVVAHGAMGWDGVLTATRSTEGGASTSFPVRGKVERLGIGPNGGRAYRVSMSARLTTPGGTVRGILYPSGTSTNTGRTYLHHAQLNRSGPSRVMVRTSTSLAARGAESLKLAQLNVAGGPLTMYQESILDTYPEGGAPLTSTAPFLGLIRGWQSTDGTFWGGGVYGRNESIVFAGSTAPSFQPGQRVEQLLSLSTDGRMRFAMRVDGGPVTEVLSTALLPPAPQSEIPTYTVGEDQLLLLNVLARGVHTLDDFKGLLP